MKPLKYFMWGYQPHFRISIKAKAESLFTEISSDLLPNLFLVGFLETDKKDRYPICIEPEDCGINPNEFKNVCNIAKEIHEGDPRKNVFCTDPTHEENFHKRLKNECFQKALQRLLDSYFLPKNITSFCSWPTLLEGYRVSTVLQFDKATFDRYYSLTESYCSLDEKGLKEYRIYRSLIDSVIDEFLFECSEALRKPSPGSGFMVIDRKNDEIIRRAGEKLMHTPGYACGNFEGLYSLFERCNYISSLRYEGTGGVGQMLFGRKGHKNKKVIISFSNPIELSDYQAARKILQMSSNKLYMLCDTASVYGLGELVPGYAKEAEDLFVVRFVDYFTWQLIHDNNVMMIVKYGMPELPHTKIKKDRFESIFKRVFKNINPERIKHFWKLLAALLNYKQGALIVISEGAEQEAQRFQHKPPTIKPFKLTEELLPSITSIDGAVIADTSATCYTIGAILDGQLSKKEKAARGSRYNSAVRYVESSKFPSVAIIISVDGMVDLIPDLKPQIKKSDIEKQIQILKSQAQAKDIDTTIINKAVYWLDEHRFYIMKDMCDEINGLRNRLKGKINKKLRDMEIQLIIPDFHPNEDMNETYYF